MILRKLYANLFFILIYCTLNSQSDEYSFSHYSMADGLIDHRVNCILEHSDGYLYIGTMNGMCRFDGYEFVPINLPKNPYNTYGSTGPRVRKLREDENGEIVIEYYIRDKEKTYINILDPKTFKVQEAHEDSYPGFSSLPFINDLQIVTLHNGKLITASDQNMNYIKCEYDSANNLLNAYLKTNANDSISLTSSFTNINYTFNFLGEDFSKRIFVITHTGLNIINPKTNLFQNYFKKDIPDWAYGNRIRAIQFINKDSLIVSLENNGLLILNLHNQQISPLDLSSNQILMSRVDSYFLAFELDDEGELWGLNNFGQFINLEIENKAAKEYKELSFKSPHDLIKLKSGELLTSGLDQDLNFVIKRFNPENESLKIMKPEVSQWNFHPISGVLLEADDGKIWVGHTQGLFLFDLEEQKIIKSYRSGSYIKQEETPYPVYPILNANRVVSMVAKSNNELWAGMDEKGINILDLEENTSNVIDIKKGLSDNRIAAMINDLDGTWVSTFNGLNFISESSSLVTKYTFENGLPHYEFNKFSFLKDDHDQFFFGTMNGLCTFNSISLNKDSSNLEIKLAEANYFDKKAATKVRNYAGFETFPSFEIPSTNRNCSFKFTTNELNFNTSNDYRYQLIPKNKKASVHNIEWQFNGDNREIRFEYLPAGHFLLRVQAFNYQGQTSDVFEINLVIRDYFYNTWWFLLSSIAVVSLILFLVFRERLHHAIKIEKLKTRLSSDLHDEVGSVLSGIAFQMEVLEDGINSENKTLVRQIATSSRSAMAKMRDVVWAMDARRNSVIDLKERTIEFIKEVIPAQKIDTKFYLDPLLNKKALSYEFRYDLLLIFKEFITNTLKHSGASELSITIKKEHDKMNISLKDNGVGIKGNIDSSSGQGIRNMIMRCEKYKGRYHLSNEGGLRLNMEFPN